MEKKMIKLIAFLTVALSVFTAKAQRADNTDFFEQQPRRSVLFVNQDEDSDEVRQAMERAAYEEEMRRRAAYEAEMQRRTEEERRKALRPVNLFGNDLKIYAEVNGEVITSRDMQDRVNAFVATTQIPINKETKSMIIEKVLETAIDEKIKLQEAEKNGITVTKEDLDKGMANFARSNSLSLPELKKMLREAKVNEDVFRSQMKAEMAWTRLVHRKAAQDIQIAQTEINKTMEAITKDIEIGKYMVSEIVIPKKKAGHIQDLVENLRHDPRFELYAVQFSESPSARNGGKLGWINKGQLSQPLEKALSKMKEGDISNPILLGNDYYILRLEKVYKPGTDKAPAPTEDEIRNMIENKKTEEIATKYLRSLRNKAVIERRA